MTRQADGILAVIPAYNEAEHIAGVVAGVRPYLPVLVVDDGSADDTAARARQAGASVLAQKPNQGKGAALRAGFRHALAEGFAAVVTLDADGQHDPADLPGFLGTFRDHHSDLIIGQRDFSQMPAIRRMSNRLGRWLFSWAVGQPIPDNQSGYRLLSRRMMEAILTSQEQGFEFEVEMIAVCLRQGYRLDWIPIRTIYAGETSHIHPLKHVWYFGRMVWRVRQEVKRQ